jgi:hypothetical protein
LTGIIAKNVQISRYAVLNQTAKRPASIINRISLPDFTSTYNCKAFEETDAGISSLDKKIFI